MSVRNASLVILSVLVARALGAEGGKPTLQPMHAYVNWEVGQIEEAEGFTGVGIVDREFINHAAVWTLHEARLSDNARFFFGVGGIYFFVFPRTLGANPYSHSKRSGLGLTDAHGEFDFWSQGNGDRYLQIKAGIFGYKYNSDAKNLGEYMFRTWTYPNVITTGGLEFVNTAGAQLSGVAANTKIGGLNNDLLLTIQSDHPPIFGLSLTDIVSYDFQGMFSVGAGFMIDNFYNSDDEQVKPTKDLRNAYYTLVGGRKLAASRYTYEIQSGLLDSAANPTVRIQSTDYYTFAGQKAMLRASVSPGKFLPRNMFFEEDLRLYYEGALLGIKDYPTYYEKLEDRIVHMVGVNVPTFRILDLLSLEMEYCSNPFKTSTAGVLESGSVTPYLSENDWGSYLPFRGDDLKWTIYAKKTVIDGFAIYAQAARDHIRMVDVYSTPDKTEFLSKRDHWYWVLKLAYSI